MKYAMAVVLFGALAAPVWAEDPGEAPDHGVARISLLSGDVTVRRGDSGEFVAAEVNAPLVSKDHVLTEDNSRAEIQLDWANFVRLAPQSEVRMAELADRDFLIQVAAGTVTFRVLRDSNSQVEISTPTVAIRPRLTGTYRITVHDDSSTEVTVRTGEAEIFAGQKTDFLRAGQTLLVSGDPADPQRSYRAGIPRDEWDRWNESRDRDLDRSDSYKYVSRDIYGAEDLAGYGRWVYDSPYGWVWVPAVDASWAPYRVGRWTWVDYYGWTWISGDPWGWAPYHYGRWYNAPRYGWVWYPGEIRVRYYWRPALVTFFGWGVNVGWVALAPYEVYRPWYGVGRTVYNNVTIVNNINVISSYRNARFVSGRSGVTSVVSGDFGRRRVTVNNFVVANDRDLTRAGDAGRWLQREPSRENRQFSDRQVSTRVSTRREPDRAFVSTRPDRNDRNRRDGGGSPRVEVRSTPRADNRSQAGPTVETARRADAPARNETAASPRNEQERARQTENDRGRSESSVSAGAAPRRNDAVTFPRNESERNRQPEPSRGRGNSASGVAAVPRPGENATTSSGSVQRSEIARRADAPQRNEAVVFPRNEGDRSRQPEGNRGRAENPIGVAAAPQRNESVTSPRNESERNRQPEPARGRGNSASGVAAAPRAAENATTSSGPVQRSETARRADAPQRNEAVVFPRNEGDRSRQPESNRGRAENPIGVAAAPQRNESVTFPRSEPERARQSDNGRSRTEGFVRREPEAARPNPAPETFRRAEPAPRSAAPEAAVPRSAPSRAPDQVVRPQEPEYRSSRPVPSAPAPTRREEARSAPAPQASSPAPGQSNSDRGNSGNGRSRSRDRR